MPPMHVLQRIVLVLMVVGAIIQILRISLS